MSTKLRWSWEEMLGAFRALGGMAENIGFDAREGTLVPLDAERPVFLRVPETLLFPIDALEFAGRSLRLKNVEDFSQPVRDFFERYENDFGQLLFAHAAALVDGFDSLSAPTRQLLIENFGMREAFEGDVAARVARRFIESRTIRNGKERILAPVVELARPGGEGLSIEYDKGIRVGGTVRERIEIFHPLHDALAIFQRFGFAAAQPAAFSLPMSLVSDGTEIAIEREMHLTEKRGEATIPRLDVNGRDSLELSHMMIGHSRFPRLARGVFRTRMRETGINDPDAGFDEIARKNTARLLRLLNALDGQEGAAVPPLKKMAFHQLEAMSWAIGAREL